MKSDQPDGPRRSKAAKYLGRGSLKKVSDADGRTVWRGDWRDADGKRCRRFLGPDRQVAERQLRKIIEERDRHRAGEVVGDDLFVEDLLRRYAEDRAGVWRSSTAAAAERVRSQLAVVFAGARCRELTATKAADYVALRRRQGVSNRTINIGLGMLRAALRWGVRRQLFDVDRSVQIQRVPEGPAYERRPRREFSFDEIRRILRAAAELDVERAALRTDRPSGRIPQAALWRTLTYTGARWGEMTAVTWADVDLDRKMLRLRADTTKTKRPRTIPLAEELIGVLCDLRERVRAALGRPLQDGEFVFLTPSGEPWAGRRENALRMFHATLARAGIPKLDVHGRSATIHGLRHSFVTLLAQARVPLIEAQHLAGHSDPKLTASRYAHFGAEDLRSAVDKLPRLDGADGAGDFFVRYAARVRRKEADGRRSAV